MSKVTCQKIFHLLFYYRFLFNLIIYFYYRFSLRAMKDYCFDYDEEKDEINGPSYRSTNPKKVVNGINLKELFDGKGM